MTPGLYHKVEIVLRLIAQDQPVALAHRAAVGACRRSIGERLTGDPARAV
jgi:hypothetical protein